MSRRSTMLNAVCRHPETPYTLADIVKFPAKVKSKRRTQYGKRDVKRDGKKIGQTARKKRQTWCAKRNYFSNKNNNAYWMGR